MPSTVLHEILARNHGMHPEFRGGLSNHLSMGAYSLAALGASDAQLKDFAGSMWDRLEPTEWLGGPTITRDTWHLHLGDPAVYASYQRYFVDEVTRAGIEATLRDALPALMPGVAAAAFHCLIRTGYGVRFHDPREVADGLAYWAIAYQPLATLAAPGVFEYPLTALDEVRRDPTLGYRTIEASLILQAMDAARARPGFAEAASTLAVRDDTLARIADATVRLFATTGDFTALHAMTATHAFRQLRPYTTHEDVRWLWQAIVAVYITLGTPSIEAAPTQEVAAWDTIIAQARGSLNEHDIKLVDVARDEEAVYGGPWYIHAAARRLRLL